MINKHNGKVLVWGVTRMKDQGNSLENINEKQLTNTSQ